MAEKVYYADFLKLVGYEESEIQKEKPRLDEAFRILGLGPEDMKYGQAKVAERYDVELLGIRKTLGVYVRALVDAVLAKEEGKKIIYFAFPNIGGQASMISLAAGPDVIVMAPELNLVVFLGSMLDKIDPLFEVAEELLLPANQAQCGLTKVRMASIAKEIVPKPNAFLSSSFQCDQEPKVDEWMSFEYGIPMILTDQCKDSAWSEFPSFKPERVGYLGSELNQGFGEVWEILGREPSEEDQEYGRSLHRAYTERLTKINNMMRTDPAPLSMADLGLLRFTKHSTNVAQYPVVLEAMEILASELKERIEKGIGVVPKGTPKAFGCIITLRDPEISRMIEKAGVMIPVNILTYERPLAALSETKSDYTSLGEKMAESEMRRGMYHSSAGSLYWVIDACRDWDMDGVVWQWPIHCRPFAFHPLMFKKAVEEELGIPFLSLEVDWFDNRSYNVGALKTKVETFAQLLAARKAKKAKQ